MRQLGIHPVTRAVGGLGPQALALAALRALQAASQARETLPIWLLRSHKSVKVSLPVKGLQIRNTLAP